ncbi:hypothetical protein B0H11DRAFT_1912071 [Mycena galericulata]|nr:hypothetical protein B0H11DRAFT_1912071 [Mycena galericulata]
MSCRYAFGEAKTDLYGATRDALNAVINHDAISALSKHTMTVWVRAPTRTVVVHDAARRREHSLDDHGGLPADVLAPVDRPKACLLVGLIGGRASGIGDHGDGTESGRRGPARGARETGADACTKGTGAGACTKETGVDAGAKERAPQRRAGHGPVHLEVQRRRVRRRLPPGRRVGWTARASAEGLGERARFDTTSIRSDSRRAMRPSMESAEGADSATGGSGAGPGCPCDGPTVAAGAEEDAPTRPWASDASP